MGEGEISKRENPLVKRKGSHLAPTCESVKCEKCDMHRLQELQEETLTAKIPPQGFALALNPNMRAKQPLCKAAGGSATLLQLRRLWAL